MSWLRNLFARTAARPSDHGYETEWRKLGDDVYCIVGGQFPSDVAPPWTVPCVYVSWDEWCDVNDSYADKRRGCLSYTDLLHRVPDKYARQDIVAKWDPDKNRWIMLTESDARTPHDRRPIVHDWIPRFEVPSAGIKEVTQ